jgi:hypothetical protein
MRGKISASYVTMNDGRGKKQGRRTVVAKALWGSAHFRKVTDRTAPTHPNRIHYLDMCSLCEERFFSSGGVGLLVTSSSGQRHLRYGI